MQLKNYSIISNEWIKNRIKHYRDYISSLKETVNNGNLLEDEEELIKQEINRHLSVISELDNLRMSQLIPAEKLASLAFDKGHRISKGGFSYIESRRDFLTNEIELK